MSFRSLRGGGKGIRYSFGAPGSEALLSSQGTICAMDVLRSSTVRGRPPRTYEGVHSGRFSSR